MTTEAIDLLTRLVSIPSPSRDEAEAARFLTGWLDAHGLAAEVDRAGNAVGVKGNGLREILLLGHIDTFSGDVPVRRAGELLYGRGAVDAKGPLCAFAVAAARAAIKPGWRITVVGAVEEESATSKGARYILSQRLPPGETEPGGKGKSPAGPPAFCVIGEPSRWDRVTLGYKGRLLLDMVLRIPFSHSAGEGRLPAEQAVDFWRQVEAHCTAFNREQAASSPFTQLAPSLRRIASRDEGSHGVIDMSLSFRLPVGLDPTALEQQIRQVAQNLPAETAVELSFSGAEKAYKGGKANDLVRAFLAAIRAAGGQPRFVVKTGTADMNVVAPHWPQTPIVAYGPGDSSLDHTPDEHLNLAEYERAIEVLQAVLEKLMGEA